MDTAKSSTKFPRYESLDVWSTPSDDFNDALAIHALWLALTVADPMLNMHAFEQYVSGVRGVYANKTFSYPVSFAVFLLINAYTKQDICGQRFYGAYNISTLLDRLDGYELFHLLFNKALFYVRKNSPTNTQRGILFRGVETSNTVDMAAIIRTFNSGSPINMTTSTTTNPVQATNFTGAGDCGARMMFDSSVNYYSISILEFSDFYQEREHILIAGELIFNDVIIEDPSTESSIYRVHFSDPTPNPNFSKSLDDLVGKCAPIIIGVACDVFVKKLFTDQLDLMLGSARMLVDKISGCTELNTINIGQLTSATFAIAETATAIESLKNPALPIESNLLDLQLVMTNLDKSVCDLLTAIASNCGSQSVKIQSFRDFLSKVQNFVLLFIDAHGVNCLVLDQIPNCHNCICELTKLREQFGRIIAYTNFEPIMLKALTALRGTYLPNLLDAQSYSGFGGSDSAFNVSSFVASINKPMETPASGMIRSICHLTGNSNVHILNKNQHMDIVFTGALLVPQMSLSFNVFSVLKENIVLTITLNAGGSESKFCLEYNSTGDAFNAKAAIGNSTYTVDDCNFTSISISASNSCGIEPIIGVSL
jgi:hypothetical protein